VRIVKEEAQTTLRFGQAEARLAVSFIRVLINWLARSHRFWGELLRPTVPMVERWIVNEAIHNPNHPYIQEIMSLIEDYKRRKGWK